MELLLNSPQGATKTVPIWKNPREWLKEQSLSSGYWVFFTIAFFFDAGFAIYYFLFNLYLLDAHFNERADGADRRRDDAGLAGWFASGGHAGAKFGIRPLLFGCLIAAPLVSAVRAWWMWESAQIGLGFMTGPCDVQLGSMFSSGGGAYDDRKEPHNGIQSDLLGEHCDGGAGWRGVRLSAAVAWHERHSS